MQDGVVAVVALRDDFVAQWEAGVCPRAAGGAPSRRDSATGQQSRSALRCVVDAIRAAVEANGRGSPEHRRALAAVPLDVRAHIGARLRACGVAHLAAGTLAGEWEVPIGLPVVDFEWTESEAVFMPSAGGAAASARLSATTAVGLVTLTGKPKRALVKAAYRAAIEDAYTSAASSSPTARDACRPSSVSPNAPYIAAAARRASDAACVALAERVTTTLAAISGGEGAPRLPRAILRRGRRLAARSFGEGGAKVWTRLGASAAGENLEAEGSVVKVEGEERQIEHGDWLGLEVEAGADGQRDANALAAHLAARFAFVSAVDPPQSSFHSAGTDARFKCNAAALAAEWEREIPSEQSEMDGVLSYTFLPESNAARRLVLARSSTIAVIRRAVSRCEGLSPSTQVVLLWEQRELRDSDFGWDWWSSVDAERVLLVTVRIARQVPRPALLRAAAAARLNSALAELRAAAFVIRRNSAQWNAAAQVAQQEAQGALERAKQAMARGVQSAVRPVLQAALGVWAGSLGAFAELGAPLNAIVATLSDAVEAEASSDYTALLGRRPAPLIRLSSLDILGEWTVHSPLSEHNSRSPRGAGAATIGGGAVDSVDKADQRPSFISAMRSLVREFCFLHSDVECAQQRCAVLAASKCAAQQRAYDELNACVYALRELGDELDIDTRGLPFCWTMDLSWLFPPAASSAMLRPTIACFVCKNLVVMDELGASPLLPAAARCCICGSRMVVAKSRASSCSAHTSLNPLASLPRTA